MAVSDILLDNDGDIYINKFSADIAVRQSIVQDVKIRLRWFLGEWRFNPPAGMPYFEEVFVKNPDTRLIAQIFRKEAMSADGVTDVRDVSVTVDNKTRQASIKFTMITDYETLREEMTISV